MIEKIFRKKKISEKLEAVAILRGGEVRSTEARSHYQLRCDLGDSSPSFGEIGDVEGFITNMGRFVTREEAKHVAVVAGQINPMLEQSQWALLSSDIDW